MLVQGRPATIMSVTIPSHLQPFIDEELATGRFADEAEFVARTIELYRETKARHVDLHEDVQRSLAEAQRGEVDDLDIEAIIARGERRLARDSITD